MTPEGSAPPVKCAVVDAYGAGRLLPAALCRYGVDYLHVRSQFPDTNLSYLPSDFTLEIQHHGDVRETAAELRRHGVTTVAAAAESGVLLANELSAALGTPGNGMRCPEARRNKFAMHQAVRAAGLASAGSIESSSADAILDWAAERGRWPVVLKPVASAGTDNVIFCDSAEAVAAAHAKISASTDRYGRANPTVLAQQFLVGEEHYVNTVSHEGVHQIIEVWHYCKRPVPGGRSINDFDDLLPRNDPGARRVAGYALSVLDALEIRNGAAHTEVMLTDDGPVLVECGARLGGGQMPDALSRCVGTNQIDSLALSIARPGEFLRQARRPYRLLSHLRCVNLISETDGVVPPAGGWAAVRALGSFAGLLLSLPEGSPVPRTIDLATCPGAVYLTSDDPAIIEADTERLRELDRTGLYTGV
ncbi:MAG TPA: ATP-grasp domain-containing protein [Streptosporangiaceae bacterium]|jgi:biotin carboxylase